LVASDVYTIQCPTVITAHGHIFGGWVLSQMDIAAGIVASRRAKVSVATVAIEAMEFIAPIHLRDLLFEDLVDVERLVPDIIIADLFMGARRVGWEFLQRLKAHPPTAPISLILCTAGQLTTEEESAAQRQGISIV